MDKTTSRIYAGIDPSLRSTGIAIIGPETTMISTIKPKKLRGVERLQYIRNTLNTQIIGCNSACIEGPALYAVNRADDIGQLRGVILVALADAGIPVQIIPPTSLKKFATGYGNATKEQMIIAAKTKSKVEILGDDEADAYWLALLAQGLHEPTSSLTRYQFDVISGIRTPRIKNKVFTPKTLNI